jgi:hypothetical protein
MLKLDTLLEKIYQMGVSYGEIEGYGLFFSPVFVEVPWHRNDYDKLRSKLKTLYHS